MAVAEKQLSKKCVANKPQSCMAERIENSVSNGTADLVFTRRNVSCWIELKCASLPKKPETPINCSHIRKGQIQWHRRMEYARNTTWCLIQVGGGRKAVYFMFQGHYIKDLREGQSLEWYQTHAFRYGSNLGKILNETLIRTESI